MGMHGMVDLSAPWHDDEGTGTSLIKEGLGRTHSPHPLHRPEVCKSEDQQVKFRFRVSSNAIDWAYIAAFALISIVSGYFLGVFR